MESSRKGQQGWVGEEPPPPTTTLQLCGVGTDGVLWHTSRLSNGAWQLAFENVNTCAGNSALRFTHLAVGGVVS